MDGSTMDGGTADGLAGARKALGHTQESLAADAGLSVRTVARAERGEAVSRESMRRITDVLGPDAASPPDTPGDTAATVPDGHDGDRDAPGGVPLLTSDDLLLAWPLTAISAVAVVLSTGVVGEPVGDAGEEGVRATMVLLSILVVIASVAARASERVAGGLTFWGLGFAVAVLSWFWVPIMGLAAVGSHLVRWTTLIVG